MTAARGKPAGTQTLPFRQSGALFHAVLENAAVGIVLVGMDGRVIYANKAFVELLAGRAAECAGRSFDDFLHPADTEVRAQIKSMIDGNEAVHHAEHRYVGGDGKPVWVLSSVSVLNSEHTGAPLYLIIHSVNIDRQKQAEEALAYSESRWHFALEAAGQGVWDHDIRKDRMSYSRMWRLMRGFGPDEHIDDSQDAWLARVHPDDVPRILAVVDKQDRGEDGFDTMEYRERHRDGRWIWMLSRGRPVEWGPDGTPVRTIGTDTDVTRFKNVEAELAEEKERLRVTLESIGDGVISTDTGSRVTFMNPAAEVMSGWPSAEAVGRPIHEVFLIEDEKSGRPVTNPLTECLSRLESFGLDEDVILVSRSSERRDIRSLAAPLHAAGGKVIGAVLVFHDMTESRSLQRELAHAATHDWLTGLPNRVAFERRLSVTVDQAAAEDREHALCFIDLDRFKAVNDGAGHAAGDALLRQVSDVIRRHCRATDFSARIGGDEFALILADCPLDEARILTQRIVYAIVDMPFTWLGTAWEIGASIGITQITRLSRSAAALQIEADAACYMAKANGRNRVSIFQPDPAARSA